jgi:hypothetical protein
VIIQHRDGSLVQDPESGYFAQIQHERCFADVPAATIDEQSSLIERLITLAFDVIGARHLEVRVRGEE